jgi:hypothetical protein
VKNLLRTAFVFIFASAALPLAAADIQIVVADGPGTGFNDPTPAAPVGGNTGTTLGAQRLIVFQEAARIWGSLLPSNVPIKVSATFTSLTCTDTTAVLGSAGATTIYSGFSNAPMSGTWYNKAEADKLAGAPQGTNPNAITARFNSDLGKTGCLTGTFFYLGLDNNHGVNYDLLVVVLHEFGHGLGFQSAADSTGAFIGSGSNRYPGIFDRFLFDTTAGKTWDQMATDADRAASSLNFGNVVWAGTNTPKYALANLSPGRLGFSVSQPPAAAGNYSFGTATFGPAASSVSVAGQIVAATDPADATGPLTTDACSPLTNASAVAGKIALIDRGTCAFVVKVKNAQNAGALAVIIADNTVEAVPGMSGTDPTITIPTISVTQADGARLRASLPATGLLGSDPGQFAGADAAGRILLYTPSIYASGSSVSHWDTSASPNLLMEPNINKDLGLTTDATLPALRDMGWFSGFTAIPTTYVLPSSAHAQGANNAFYTTSLWVANTGPADSTIVLQFLGHDAAGTGGPSTSNIVVPAGQTVAFPDVLSSLFNVSSGYGAILVRADSNQLKIVSQTSTPPPSGAGSFGQAVPAATGNDSVTPAAPKALYSLRQDAAFRTNAVISNTTASAAHVDLKLYDSAGMLIGSSSNLPNWTDLQPLEMRQIGGVVTALGGPDGTKDAYLVVSTPTGGARLATYAAVIDQKTNDPRTILPVTLGTLGANAKWLLPSSAHAPGANNAFYTTDLTIGNSGTTSAMATLKFLGHDQDGTSGPEVTSPIAAGAEVTFADVLGSSVFGLPNGSYGAILVTSASPDLKVLSQTSTPPPNGIGTFGQSVPAAGPADFVTSAAPRVLVGLRQDSAFRTNAVIANATNQAADVVLTLTSAAGATLGTHSYHLDPYGMHQISGVVTELGAPAGTADAALTVATTTPGARIATYAAIIDQTTNDPKTVLP